MILRDTGAQPWQELTCYDRVMTREADGYRMTAEYFDEEAEQTRELDLHFRDAEAVLEVFRAESVEERPWVLLEDLARETPVGRLGEPEDVAKAMLYLSEAEFVTGQVLPVNGGFII